MAERPAARVVPMKKLVARWIGMFAFVVLLAVVFVKLGDWQLDRLDQKRDSNAQITTNENREPSPYSQVFTRTITDADQWQRVVARGTFDADHQFQARYRNSEGQPGIEVLTPLVTSEGHHLLIDRGFIARAPGQPDPEVLPAPPAGEVEVVGYVRRNEQGKPEATEPHGQKVRLINTAALNQALPYELLDGYVSLATITPEQEGAITPLPLPQLNEGPHLSYAIQWFCFTVIALGGLGILIRADLRDRRRAIARLEGHQPAPEGGPEPTEGGATPRASAEPAAR